MKSLKELIADAKAAIESLEQAEAGWLPYCEDPDDGCAEEWEREMAEFAKAAVELLTWPTGKRAADATIVVKSRALPSFVQKQAEDRLHRLGEEPRPVQIVEFSTPGTSGRLLSDKFREAAEIEAATPITPERDQ